MVRKLLKWWRAHRTDFYNKKFLIPALLTHVKWVVILLKWTVDIYFVKWPLRVHCSHLVFPTISSFRVRRRFVNQFLHSVPLHNLSSSISSGNYKTLHQPNIHHHSHLPKPIYWSGWPFSRVVVALRLVNQKLCKHLGQTIFLGKTFLGERSRHIAPTYIEWWIRYNS